MKRILVVEDNNTNMYLIRFVLERNGFQVIEARNGLMGVELAIKEKPDLIIMDIQLPDIDGLEAAQRIRVSKDNGEVPIIALTSYAMAGDRQKAVDAGCNGYIEKPIDPEKIVAQINKFFKTSPKKN